MPRRLPALTTLVLAHAAVVTAATDNLLTNGDAEAGDGLPAHWERVQAVRGVEYVWDRSTAYDGESSLCLKKTIQRFFPIAQWRQAFDHDADHTKIRVGATIKAQSAYKAILDIQFWDGRETWTHAWVAYVGAQNAGDPPADHDWMRYEGVVEIPNGTKRMAVGLQIYGPGNVWFDDVTARYVGDATPITDALTVRPTALTDAAAAPDGPPAVPNLDFETEADGIPGHWFTVGNAFELTVDRQIKRSGEQSGRIRYTSDTPRTEGAFGTFSRMMDAVPLRGRAIRFSGFLRGELEEGFAGLWMRVDGADGRVLAFDNMHERGLTGTSDWTPYEIVLDVPQGASRIAFGVLLVGTGTAWVDDLAFEEVGADVKVQEIPDTPPPAGAAPSQDLLAGGDPDKRFFLIGPHDPNDVPQDGWRLLLVLPGGDGSADFHPFVGNIYRQAVPKGYLLAQLVAPKWSENHFDSVVWPTLMSPFPEMKFDTETFVDAVITDVAARYPIDEAHVYTLSWSSGGPAAYATSLHPETRVTGSFVVMSVFRPDWLPDLAAAEGQAYYILHSPQDFIPMTHPEQARDTLAEHGARTTLVTYEGGHGWHGDAFGNIRAGIAWLELREERE